MTIPSSGTRAEPLRPTASMPVAYPDPPLAVRDPDEHPRLHKSTFLTTEFIAFVAMMVITVITAQLVQTTTAHADYLRADTALLFMSILTAGYMISRGLAKCGRR
jgi:hypothetical protein